jgi:hypothetical protein
LIVKFIRLVVVVAFLGVAASAALADGVPTDPTLLTSGCGRLGQPKCDAYLISSSFEVLTVALMLDNSTDPTDPFVGDAIASFVNISGTTLAGPFTINFTVPAGLSFQGCGGSELITPLFTCSGGGNPDSPITGGGSATFTLSGASICSVDIDDLGGGEGTPPTYVSDNDTDDNCQAAFTLALKPVAGETLPQSIIGTFTAAPEPSSGVLLLFGLATGLLVLKGLRTNLA